MLGPLLLNPESRAHIKAHQLEVDWTNVVFVLFFMVMGLIAAPLYFIFNPISMGPFILLVVLYWLVGLSVTMGYHRLFSHKAFKANKLVEFFLLIFGSMALEHSALKWSSDHRTHHQFTDTDKDPYNANLGLLWSHLLWIFFSKKSDANFRLHFFKGAEALAKEFPNCQDLIKNPLIRFQHALSLPLGVILSLAIPAAVGYFVGGDVWAYVLVAGFARITLLHHSTFTINSLAHFWGKKNYHNNDSSKDSFWVALISLGEGYHNYHHSYPTDYRNGIRAYHFDPTKWVIFTCSRLGLTWDLKRARGQLL